MWANLAVGAGAAAIIAYAAYRLRALTGKGALAAFFVGTMTYAGLGIRGAVILAAFFLSSTALSRLGKARKKRLVDVEKQGARDALQVLANGGVAALCAAITIPVHDAPNHWAIAFAGAFAAATADTWGTEIGTLAPGTPRSILTGKPIAAGLSGGVTIIGTLAEIFGALFIGWVSELAGLHALLPIVLGGCCGALLDSFLGAGMQSLRWCPCCARACETSVHVCGTTTRAHHGFSWMTNDLVNCSATLCGALISFIAAG